MTRSPAARLWTAIPAALLALFSIAPAASAQGLKIAAGDVGIGIGPVPELTGLRINFRDGHRLRRVTGINATIWTPYEDVRGNVYGLALGLPLTGARDLKGLGLGAGLAIHGDFSGIGLSVIGAGAGGDMTGIAFSGLGLGAGGSATGLLVGGLGAGVGEDATGVIVGGVGAGAGGDIEGLVASLGGVGAGGDVTGVAIAGLGVGAGGHLRYISIAGLGVGAPEITGFAAALGVGGMDITGLILAPAYFRIEDNEGRNPGSMRGVVLSAYSDVRGSMSGLQIGLINIADELHGLQLGLINIARNKDRFPVLPILNYHR